MSSAVYNRCVGIVRTLLRPQSSLVACCSSFHSSQRNAKTFEPEYLDAGGLKPSKYGKVNVQMKGYDFDILENYQSFVHNTAENIGIDVIDGWATPCKSTVSHTYMPVSTKIKDSIKLNYYERNVQIDGASSLDLPILVDILQRTLPPGVSLSVHEHADEHYEARFIPDPLINSIKEELDVIETARAEQIAQKRAEREAKGKK